MKEVLVEIVKTVNITSWNQYTVYGVYNPCFIISTLLTMGLEGVYIFNDVFRSFMNGFDKLVIHKPVGLMFLPLIILSLARYNY